MEGVYHQKITPIGRNIKTKILIPFKDNVIHYSRRFTSLLSHIWRVYLLKAYNYILSYLSPFLLKITVPLLNWLKYIILVTLGQYGLRTASARVYIYNGGLMRSQNQVEATVNMKNHSKYGVVIKNISTSRLVAKLTINNTLLGSYVLNPGASYTIKRPLNDEHQFQFVSALPPTDTRVKVTLHTIINQLQAQLKKKQQMENERKRQESMKLTEQYMSRIVPRRMPIPSEDPKEDEPLPPSTQSNVILGEEKTDQKVLGTSSLFTQELHTFSFKLTRKENIWREEVS